MYLASAMQFDYPHGWLFPIATDWKDQRLHFRGHSAIVYAWPSTGGRLELLDPSPFDLTFLGIEDHLVECNKSTNSTEEDAFVAKLRRLGGTFYEYTYGVREALFSDGLEDDSLVTWLGWPEDEAHQGGVWVLKIKQNEMRKTGRIRLATTMQDRCRAIELCGGEFFAVPGEEHLVSMEKERCVPEEPGDPTIIASRDDSVSWWSRWVLGK